MEKDLKREENKAAVLTDGQRDPLCWEEIRTEHIITDEWIDIRRSAYRFPDGSEFEPFYSYSRKSYVVIVAVDTEGKYLCVRQFRQGIKKVTCEFPAGGLEKGEDPLDAAKRELLEETGYEADEWRSLLTVPSNATIADNYAYIFMAGGCRKVSGQELDDTEFLRLVRFTGKELKERIRTGGFEQAIHILAYFLSKSGEGF